MLQKIKHLSLVDQVIIQIESLIESGIWPIGKKIPPEPDLVNDLNISRNTLREGIGAGCSFSLAMILFGLRTTNAHDAAELSGMSQSVGYVLAAVGPILFGYLHDLTKGWNVPLIVLLVITILMLIFGIISGRNRLIGEENA